MTGVILKFRIFPAFRNIIFDHPSKCNILMQLGCACDIDSIAPGQLFFKISFDTFFGYLHESVLLQRI